MDFLKQKGPLAREFCNTLIYIISLVSLKPSSLQRVLTELQWNGMWFFSLAFFAVIFMEMLSDFLLEEGFVLEADGCQAYVSGL